MMRTRASVNFVDLKRFTASLWTTFPRIGAERMRRPKPARAEGPMFTIRIARMMQTWTPATQPMWQ